MFYNFHFWHHSVLGEYSYNTMTVKVLLGKRNQQWYVEKYNTWQIYVMKEIRGSWHRTIINKAYLHYKTKEEAKRYALELAKGYQHKVNQENLVIEIRYFRPGNPDNCDTYCVRPGNKILHQQMLEVNHA